MAKAKHPAGWFGRLVRRLILLSLAFVVAWHAYALGWLLWWNYFPVQETAFMSARLDNLKREDPDAELQHRWVDYDDISRHLKRAVMVAEDSGFTQHQGFDWEGIRVAFEKNIKEGEIVAGGSTISQQLAKNLFLSSARSPVRKLQEASLTVMMEAVLSKRRIFEIYLNSIEWGERVYGAEAAARHYFGTSAKRLTRWQAARLAAMIPRPRYYDKHRSTRYLARRTATIAARMHQVLPPR